jgi:hypothetical protein
MMSWGVAVVITNNNSNNNNNNKQLQYDCEHGRGLCTTSAYWSIFPSPNTPSLVTQQWLISPPTAAHHSFACKLLVTQSVISCVQINHITTCKLAGCKRAPPTLSTMALCSRDFFRNFGWWIISIPFIKKIFEKNLEIKKNKIACKICLSPKNCHFVKI